MALLLLAGLETQHRAECNGIPMVLQVGPGSGRSYGWMNGNL
jgi:hypothetical protein